MPPPSLAGWMPRGHGKSALVAALGLYDLMLGAEGVSAYDLTSRAEYELTS